MTTTKEIIQGAKIETSIGLVEIGEIKVINNVTMVYVTLNNTTYRNELNDLVAFINENI